ncbi:hypothetical protein JZO67_004113 [Enterococcus sp. 665A]|uniref:Uncharacterized protein n=1 Tax=Candidatus Enterococcus ferrettii TaxID=2815324 RepID=A0ABV0EU08_9ENTE
MMTSFPINQQLNPYFETLFLLHLTPFDEKAKQETLAELDHLGIDAASFYENHYSTITSYYSTFEENRVATASSYFGATDSSNCAKFTRL